jgi:hypothetical protein
MGVLMKGGIVNPRSDSHITRTAVLCLVILWSTLQLTGCAVPIQSTANYVDPVLLEHVANQLVLDEEFDVVWNKLISGLSSEFFVITNVEKASGLITLDFSTNEPERFVDCGTVTRTYGGESTTFAVAGDYSFKHDEIVGVNVARKNVIRHTALSGKINVHVARFPDGTRVTVNARYIWNLELGGTYVLAGSLASGPTQSLQRSNHSKSFNTNSVSGPDVDLDFTCGPNGELEDMILDIVR